VATGSIKAPRKWQATAFNPDAATVANIFANAEDIIIRVYIPDTNFDITQAVSPLMLQNMSGTHIFVMSGYCWDSLSATLIVRLSISSSTVSINRCAVNGTDKTGNIQLYYRMP
jgi:hypothetical protein